MKPLKIAVAATLGFESAEGRGAKMKPENVAALAAFRKAKVGEAIALPTDKTKSRQAHANIRALLARYGYPPSSSGVRRAKNGQYWLLKLSAAGPKE